VCTFLTLHDIMLLIYTLECLYSLSSLGERACNCIVRVHGAIDTLVSLITVEVNVLKHFLRLKIMGMFLTLCMSHKNSS